MAHPPRTTYMPAAGQRQRGRTGGIGSVLTQAITGVQARHDALPS